MKLVIGIFILILTLFIFTRCKPKPVYAHYYTLEVTYSHTGDKDTIIQWFVLQDSIQRDIYLGRSGSLDIEDFPGYAAIDVRSFQLLNHKIERHED